MAELITLDYLRSRHDMIVNLTSEMARSYAINVEDPYFGEEFRYHLLFSNKNLSDAIGLLGLSDEERFYNKYYWFQMFMQLHQKKFGFDAGLEQQSMQLLETAGIDLDYKLIEHFTTDAVTNASKRAVV